MDQDIGGAIAALKKHGLETLPPLGIVLGSGLGPFADEATDAVAVAYSRAARLSGPERRGPCGTTGGRRDRGQAGRSVSGPRPLL